MPVSIDYLNARKANKAASGGTNYAQRKLSTAAQNKARVDEKARDASRDAIDIAHDYCLAQFAEFRSWFRNLPSVADIANGTTADDMVF